MTRQRLCYLFILLTLCVGVVGVQHDAKIASASGSNQEINALATAIDNRASMNGLPSGDGVISPAENAISEVIWNDIHSFNQDLTSYEASSPANAAAIDNVEITVSDYYVKVFDPASRPDAEADMGKSLQELTDELVNDLYMQHLTDELIQEILVDQARQDLLEASEEYLAENAAANAPQKVGESIRQGTSDYIQNDPKIKRKNINRKRIDNMIEFYVPSQLLPTNGMWRVRPYTATFTGNCDTVAMGVGKGDGTGGSDLDNPGEPLCGFENPGGLPFITWQYNMHMYLPGTSSIYSDLPEIGYVASRTTANGPTNGSQRSVTTVEYEVVAPDLIHVHLLTRFSGGCTIEADYEIELVTADESVCPDLSSYDPTKGDTEPVEIIPGQGPQDMPVKDDDVLPIEEPPVAEGPYTVGLPIMPPSPQCSLPQLSEVRLLDQGDGALVLDYGSGQQMLYRDGRTSYSYDSGFGPSGWENVSLNFNADGSGYLTWNKTDTSGLMCSVSQNLTLPGMATDTNTTTTTTVPDSTTVTDPIGSTNTTTPSSDGGEYAVVWTTAPGMCPDEMLPTAPSFDHVSVSYGDGMAVITYDGGTMTLTDDMGVGSYTLTDTSANPMVIIALTNLGQAGVIFNWMAMPSSGMPCSVSATFDAMP